MCVSTWEREGEKEVEGRGRERTIENNKRTEI